MAKVEPTADPIVAVGKTQFGNTLPLALIAGPCALESQLKAVGTCSSGERNGKERA